MAFMVFIVNILTFDADVMEDLYNYVNPLNERHSPMIAKETLNIILANKDVRRHVSSFACFCFIV